MRAPSARDARNRAKGTATDPDTRKRLVEVTRSFVENAGAEDLALLSVRKISAEAGVAPTSLYWHFGNRRGLLDAVLDAMIADLPPLRVRGRTSRSRILSLTRSMRAQVRAAEAAHRLAQDLGRVAELSVPAQVLLAKEVSAAGLTGAKALRATRSILYVVGGWILVEDHYRHRRPGGPTSQELWRAVQDPDINSSLRAAMTSSEDSDALFTYTLERLLQAVLPGDPTGPGLTKT